MDVAKIIKELASFFGQKLDAIANKKSIGVEIIGAEVITLKGEKGDKGDPGEPGRNTPVPGPQGPAGRDGRNGVDGRNGRDGKDGVNGVPGRPGKDGSPDTGEQIIQKINADKSGKTIKKEHVEGLADIESIAKTAEANSQLGLRAGGDTIYMTDLSSQTNGNTFTFTIPQYRVPLFVLCSDFPTILMLNNGFTVVQGTLTLTTPTAPSSGAQLGFCYKI